MLRNTRARYVVFSSKHLVFSSKAERKITAPDSPLGEVKKKEREKNRGNISTRGRARTEDGTLYIYICIYNLPSQRLGVYRFQCKMQFFPFPFFPPLLTYPAKDVGVYRFFEFEGLYIYIYIYIAYPAKDVGVYRFFEFEGLIPLVVKRGDRQEVVQNVEVYHPEISSVRSIRGKYVVNM